MKIKLLKKIRKVLIYDFYLDGKSFKKVKVLYKNTYKIHTFDCIEKFLYHFLAKNKYLKFVKLPKNYIIKYDYKVAKRNFLKNKFHYDLRF